MMTNIQRFEPWPQEWPMEDNDGDLVLYEDHRKIVEAIEIKLAKVVEVLQWILDYRDVCFIPEPWDDMANDVLTELEGK